MNDYHLLRLGRHFRLGPSCKAIVGRDEAENERILNLAGDTGISLNVPDYGSPVTLILGPAVTEDDIGKAAALLRPVFRCPRTGDGSCGCFRQRRHYTLKIRPANAPMVESLLIEKKKKQTSAILY